MLLHVREVLNVAEVAESRRLLEQARWVDGRVTAGHLSAKAKRNLQVPEDDPVARRLGDTVVAAVERSPAFLAGALPRRIFPPLFNRYEAGQAFDGHVDNAIRQVPGTPYRIRTDLSATLFLSDPADYDGGELAIDDVYGVHRVKLPAGDLILYPASSLHHVRPVTRGVRLAAFFWVQSLVRDDARRTLLFDMDLSIQRLGESAGQTDPSVVALTGCYHNLLRMWAEP